MILQRLFQIAASACSLYSTLCFIRIILSWIPGVLATRPGQLLCSIVDPYMNLFRKLPLTIGMIDFSPIVSMGLLSLVSSILNNIASTGILNVKNILMGLDQFLWSICFTIGMIFLVLIAVRLIVLAIHKGTTPYNSGWARIDYYIQDRIFKISHVYTRGKPCSYKTALLLSLLSTIFFLIITFAIYTGLAILFSFIPF
ncbi:MAG: YggT family protein [Treponema sp.]|nr:YggT family protein [Treponema sp.]